MNRSVEHRLGSLDATVYQLAGTVPGAPATVPAATSETGFPPRYSFGRLLFIFIAAHYLPPFGNICNGNDKIRLARRKRLSHSLIMSLGRKALEKIASRLATARYDNRESTEESRSESLNRPAKAFSLAAILQVPVGYQDELGFHCGQPQVGATPPVLVVDREDLRTNIT